ncbi:hypothetical protein PHMEG_00028549 [Phytophthora megakarya]|uniref:Uncharacterized protein n=1 Tax=Phytophthora megakarya TaxID=4795 RepID=A0A225V4R8_9STRA|nr:hypothetical protein PHMEG_00028549 [Phytophthora megakarya]
MRNYDWQIVVLSDQDCYIRRYLESLRTSFNEGDLPVAWKRPEAHYGQSNAQGMAALVAEFDKSLEMDFSSVGQLIVRVKEMRSRINRRSRENLKGVTMIPNQNNVDYTSEGFHVDNIEALLRNVFMDKSKSQIQAMQTLIVPANYVAFYRPLGKRKWKDELKKKGGDCFYCEGRYNRDGGTHRKANCPKMKKDRSIGLSVGVSHVKGEKKGFKKKANPMREEIPAHVALMQPISKVEVTAVVKGMPQEPEPGYGAKLTSEQDQASEEFRFTFGEGTKLSNTHVGTVKLYFQGPDGIRPFEFDNMQLVPKALANILSELCDAFEPCKIPQSGNFPGKAENSA